ncbi:MAG: hypothetical protein ACOYN4_15350 [Bacteroidales bacterium]
MKTTFRFFIFFALLSGFLLSGCETTETPVGGDDVRDPFIGYWQFLETGGYKSTKAQSYIVIVSKDPDNSTQVLLKNFGNPGTQDINVVGIVTSNQIVVSQQNMSNGWVVEGSGKISNPTKTAMTWTYSITAGGEKLYYSANATRQ